MKVFIESKLTFVYDFGNNVVLIPGVSQLESNPNLEKTLKSDDFKARVKIGQFKVLTDVEAKKELDEIHAEIKRREAEGKQDGKE